MRVNLARSWVSFLVLLLTNETELNTMKPGSTPQIALLIPYSNANLCIFVSALKSTSVTLLGIRRCCLALVFWYDSEGKFSIDS